MAENKYFWSFVRALVSAGLLLMVGCESTIDPFAEETGQFAIYGFLSVSEGEHFLRVEDLNDPLVPGSTRVISATVTLENLDTGGAEMLVDSIVVFDGIYTHNFRSDQIIQPGATYRITVERPDGGGAAHATATMPPLTEVGVAPEGPATCTEPIEFHFRNVPEPRLLRAAVGVDVTGGRVRWTDLETPEVGADGTPIHSFSASSILRNFYPQPVLDSIGPPSKYCVLIDDKKLRLAYTHFGPDWPPDSLLTDPLESPVENGVGVFGGLHRDTLVKSIELAE